MNDSDTFIVVLQLTSDLYVSKILYFRLTCLICFILLRSFFTTPKPRNYITDCPQFKNAQVRISSQHQSLGFLHKTL